MNSARGFSKFTRNHAVKPVGLMAGARPTDDQRRKTRQIKDNRSGLLRPRSRTQRVFWGNPGATSNPEVCRLTDGQAAPDNAGYNIFPASLCAHFFGGMTGDVSWHNLLFVQETQAI